MGKKSRGDAVNLDSFLDIMTCLVGVLVLIIILTGVDASQIKMLVPTPMRTETDKRPVFVECRHNQLFPIPVHSTMPECAWPQSAGLRARGKRERERGARSPKPERH